MKVLKWLDEYLEETLMTLMLIVIFVVTIVQVFFRYVLNFSLSWSNEVACYCLVWSGFLSVSFCVKKRISIKIDQLQNALPDRLIPWVKMLRHTIVFVFSIIMLPYAVACVGQSMRNLATSPALKLPMYYIQASTMVCFVLLAIRAAQAWVREFRASRGIMHDGLVDALKAESLEQMKEEEEAEIAAWHKAHDRKEGEP